MTSDPRHEPWTEHDGLIRAAMQTADTAHGTECLEPDDLIALVEQGGDHPRAEVLLRHVVECGAVDRAPAGGEVRGFHHERCGERAFRADRRLATRRRRVRACSQSRLRDRAACRSAVEHRGATSSSRGRDRRAQLRTLGSRSARLCHWSRHHLVIMTRWIASHDSAVPPITPTRPRAVFSLQQRGSQPPRLARA